MNYSMQIYSLLITTFMVSVTIHAMEKKALIPLTERETKDQRTAKERAEWLLSTKHTQTTRNLHYIKPDPITLPQSNSHEVSPAHQKNNNTEILTKK